MEQLQFKNCQYQCV